MRGFVFAPRRGLENGAQRRRRFLFPDSCSSLEAGGQGAGQGAAPCRVGGSGVRPGKKMPANPEIASAPG